MADTGLHFHAFVVLLFRLLLLLLLAVVLWGGLTFLQRLFQVLCRLVGLALVVHRHLRAALVGKERIFDDMNNGFGWDRLPKSFMAENTVFLLLTALIRNFYKAIIQRLDVKRFGLNATSRIKAFVFRFISVPAKWIRTSRRYVLNIYTCNNAYADIFQTDFG